MLRVVTDTANGPVQTLKLEGKLQGPWVDEVRKACSHSLASSSRTSLDLSALTFVDEDGAELLRSLIRGGVEVVACSSYVAELLQLAR